MRTKTKKWNPTISRLSKYVLILVAAWLISHFWFQLMLVQGTSMEPTLHAGQLVWIQKCVSTFRRGDIVLLAPDGRREHIVKRVAAVPGDMVVISEGLLIVNGQAEDATFERMETAGILAEPMCLGEGEYVVLGDNRNHSVDSRMEEVGVVTEEQLLGKVLLAGK